MTKILSFVVAGSLMAAAGMAADKVAPKAGDTLEFAQDGSVKFSGWIGREIDTCKKGRIFGQSIPDLIGPFANREEDRLWRCEFWGKWYTSAVLAYRYQADPKLREVVDKAVNDLIATQTPDGCITTYKHECELAHWEVWGRKYTLLGLLAYYDLTNDAKALKAACRLADYTLTQIGPGKADISTLGWWNGLAASSILEPMVLLYRQTGEKRYLDFCEYIVKSWEGPKGPDLVRKAINGVSVFKMFPGPDSTKKGYGSGGQSKSYEMMSCYEGLVELYRVTGEPKYLEAARKVFADIRDTEITIVGSGSSWERWCNGRARQTEPVPEWMETCVTVTWLKFAAQMLRISGDSSYADDIERTTYNPLLAAQKDDGTWWCHYNPLEGYRESAPEHCKMHMNCCVANGPRGLMLLPKLAIMSDKAGPVVNLYEPGTANVLLNSAKTVKLDIKSDYPRNNVVDISLRPQSPEQFTLSLRIPAWSRTTKVEINGHAVADVRPGTYAKLARVWKAGDRVRMTFDFTTRLEKDPGNSGRVAIMRGPVVFALDKRISKGVAKAGTGKVIADVNGAVKAVEVKGRLAAGVKMALDVPFEANGKRVMIRFCDYASAGHTWTEDSMLRVWLPQPMNVEDPMGGVTLVKVK